MPTAVPVENVAATAEPVTIADAKKQLELPAGDSDHDGHLSRLITFAREQVEHDTGIVALTTTYIEKRDEWPNGSYYELSKRPVQSITSIAYIDANGDSQTWGAANYELDSGRTASIIWLAYNVTWPAIRSIQNAITTTYVAGDTSRAALSEQYRHAVLLRVSQEFCDREGLAQKFEGAYQAIVNRLMRATYP